MIKYENSTLKIYIRNIKHYTDIDPTIDFAFPVNKIDREKGEKYFILLTLKKKKFMDTGVLDFFNKKLILDFYFCLMSGPVEIYVIFIHLFDSGILSVIDLNYYS
jgi:hypothetical protein